MYIIYEIKFKVGIAFKEKFKRHWDILSLGPVLWVISSQCILIRIMGSDKNNVHISLLLCKCVFFTHLQSRREILLQKEKL